MFLLMLSVRETKKSLENQLHVYLPVRRSAAFGGKRVENYKPIGVGDQTILPMGQFVPLIAAEMLRTRTSCAELSRRTGLSKAKLSRCLAGKNAIDLVTVKSLFIALEIDSRRALLAINHYGDWSRYHDPDCELISGLLDRLPETMAKARDVGERVALANGGLQQLATRICEMVAENDRKVVERRDAFIFDGEGSRRVA
jgi:hypothetical protein